MKDFCGIIYSVFTLTTREIYIHCISLTTTLYLCTHIHCIVTDSVAYSFHISCMKLWCFTKELQSWMILHYILLWYKYSIVSTGQRDIDTLTKIDTNTLINTDRYTSGMWCFIKSIVILHIQYNLTVALLAKIITIICILDSI